jgi:hypothetical protein
MSNLEKLSESYSKAIEHMRSTAKWILSVFAAVAGVLVAGLQLSNLGKVETFHLAVSALAFLTALIAIMRIIWKTVRVLGTGTVTEKSLVDFAAQQTDIPLNDPLLLGGYKTVVEFINKYKELGFDYEKAQKENDPTAVERLKGAVAELNYHRTYLLLVAKYAMVLQSFNQAIRGLFFYAVVAAIAIGVFAWATGQKTTAHLIFQSPPSAASVTLTASGKKLLKDSLGEKCVEQTTIPVIVLSAQDGKFEVITTPSAQCKVSKFTVDMSIGTVKSTP